MIRYDLHVHTSEVSGCGMVPGARMAELYAQAGYGGIVITDHFTRYQRFAGEQDPRRRADAFLAGYRAARRAGEALGLTVLPGLELRFDHGDEDFLVFGVDEEWIYAHSDAYHLGRKAFHRLAQVDRLLVVQAHPCRPGLRRADHRVIDGVEVVNRNPRQQNNNGEALRFAKRYGLLGTGGSDAHQPQDVGRSGILGPAGVDTPAKLVELLGSGAYEVIR